MQPFRSLSNRDNSRVLHMSQPVVLPSPPVDQSEMRSTRARVQETARSCPELTARTWMWNGSRWVTSSSPGEHRLWTALDSRRFRTHSKTKKGCSGEGWIRSKQLRYRGFAQPPRVCMSLCMMKGRNDETLELGLFIVGTKTY